MKANELRIGNLVYDADRDIPRTILEIHEDWVRFTDRNGSFCEKLTGIPLTEEWLVKLKFDKSKTHDKYYTKGNSYAISTADNKFRFIQGNFVCQLVLKELLYVHQLQNLYFALIGEEL